jgi:predicted transglutaminase-like protease
MNKIKDEMMNRYIKETSCRGINNNLRKEVVDNIKKNKLDIFEHKKAEKSRILEQKKKI